MASGAELDFNASDASGYSLNLALTNAGTLNKINAQSETLGRPIILTNGIITSTSFATSGNGINEAYNFFGNYIRTMAGTTNLITGVGQFGLRTATCYFTNEPNSTLTIACVIKQDANSSASPLNKTGPGTLILSRHQYLFGGDVHQQRRAGGERHDRQRRGNHL